MSGAGVGGRAPTATDDVGMERDGWRGRSVLVAGARVSGVAVAEALLDLGARVTVTDRSDPPDLASLARRGAEVRLDLAVPPRGTDVVVVSPGWRPDSPLLLAAAAAGIEVYSEPELAWRLREPHAGTGRPVPWLAVTGTNGKTTTVTMLAAVLAAAGLRTVAAGNVGHPLVRAVLDPVPYDVLAVELSSFQLHWSVTLAPEVGALLNLADDHLDWHGGPEPYAEAKAAVWRGAPGALAVGNVDDAAVRALLDRAPAGGRRVGFTLGVPAAGQMGLVEDLLVDRVFGPGGPADAVELGTVDDVSPPGAHNVANALAAATLARAYGVPAEAVRTGLRGYTPEPHRNAAVRTRAGVTWVDDSKATNPHAAAASLLAHPRVVWVAGGLLKGVDVDDLVRLVAPRLAGVVLLGADRSRIAEALARHAPRVPVAEVASTDDGAMVEVVTAAARLARPGDTVLLAPAAASMDMFRDYGHRGDAYAAAVARLPDQPGSDPAGAGGVT